MLAVAFNEDMDAGIREVALAAIEETDEMDNDGLSNLIAIMCRDDYPQWLRVGALRCLAAHNHPDIAELIGAMFDEWREGIWEDHSLIIAYKIAAGMNLVSLSEKSFSTLEYILKRHRVSAASKGLSIVAFRACGTLLGRNAPQRMLPLIENQSVARFLYPYFGSILAECAVTVLEKGTALALAVDREYRSWVHALSCMSVDSLVKDIHNNAPRHGDSVERFQEGFDLRVIAIADSIMIKIMDKGIEPCEFLYEYHKLEHLRRIERIELDASTLATLWRVGRFWR